MAETHIKCSCCGKEKRLIDYYNSSSPIHKYYGKLTICKDCLAEMVDMNNVRSLMNVMRMIDKPFLIAEYEGSLEKERNQFGEYMRRLAMRQNRMLTWDDSEMDETYVEDSSYSSELSPDVIERWRGWDEDKIVQLESHYQDLINTYEHDTPIQRSIYRNISVAQMQADEAIANGKSNDYKKYMDVISGLMNDAKIKPLQETSAEDGTLSTWGQWVAKIEEEEPIPEPTEEFKDVDGISKYVQKWFVGHMKRMLGIDNQLPSKDEDGGK